MSKAAKVVVPVADGTEEMEAVIIIDILRRGGVDVVVASIGNEIAIQGSRGVRIVADTMWSEVDLAICDAIILPGGAVGTDNLRAFAPLVAAIADFCEQGRLVGAICAAPLVLQDADILRSCPATCYPTLGKELATADYRDSRVVKSGNIITSQGPGTAMEFALVLVEQLQGREVAAKVKEGLVLHPAI